MERQPMWQADRQDEPAACNDDHRTASRLFGCQPKSPRNRVHYVQWIYRTGTNYSKALAGDSKLHVVCHRLESGGGAACVDFRRVLQHT